jgi:hypothetical protein
VGDKHLKLYKLIFNATENSDRWSNNSV